MSHSGAFQIPQCLEKSVIHFLEYFLTMMLAANPDSPGTVQQSSTAYMPATYLTNPHHGPYCEQVWVPPPDNEESYTRVTLEG